MNTIDKYKNITLKQLTLIAWTKILLDKGTIDIKKYSRMVEKIGKISA